MASILRPRLQPLIKSELERLDRHVSSKGTCDFDLYFDKAWAAQVIYVRGNDAELSDGSHTIVATFDPATIIRMAQPAGWGLEKLKGAIIIIEKYSLIIESENITLRILQSSLKGSQGSKTFGKPTDLLADREIRNYLDRWAIRAGSHDSTKSYNHRRKQSGDEQETSKVNNADSQQRLSTQIPSAAAQNTSVGNEAASQVSRNPVSPTEPTTKTAVTSRTEPGHELLALLNNPKQPAAPKQEPAWKAQMDFQKKLVQQHQRPSTSPARNGSSSAAGGSKSAYLSPEFTEVVSDDTSPQVLTQIPQQHAGAMASKLESQANRQVNSVLTKSEVNTETSLPPMKEHNELPSSQGSEKENSQECRGSFGNASRADVPRATQSKAQMKEASLPFVDAFQTQNPFEGLKRVPRNYVRISPPQAKLLNSNDAWYPGNENRRNHAHIPIGVQDGLVAFRNKAFTLRNENEIEGQAGKRAKLAEADDEKCDPSGYESALDELPSDSKGPMHSARVDQDDGSDDASSITWSPSSPPQPALRSNETVEDSRQLGDGIAPQSSSPQATIPKPAIAIPAPLRVPFAVSLNSSPVEEDEIELAVPYAVGEMVDDSKASGEYPSTAEGRPRLVQVEKTPHTNIRTSNNDPQHINSSPEKVTRRVPSSDPRIPATFNDVDSDEAVSNEDESSDKVKEEADYTPTVPKSSFRPAEVVDLCSDSESEDEDDTPLAQIQSSSKIQRQAPSGKQNCVDQKSDHDVDEAMEDGMGEQDPSISLSRPSHDQHRDDDDEVSHSQNKRSAAFPPSPVSGSRESSLKRTFEELGEVPAKVYVKKQKRFKIATTLKDVNTTPIDTKAIARAHRQSFKDSLKDQTAQNQTRFSQESSTSPRVIPNTMPAKSSASKASPEVLNSLPEQETIPKTQSSSIGHFSGTRQPSQINETEAAPESGTGALTADEMEGVETVLTRDGGRVGSNERHHEKDKEDDPAVNNDAVENPTLQANEQHLETEANSILVDPEATEESDEDIFRVSQERAEEKVESSKCIGYEEFKAKYSSYKTDKKNFTWALVYVEFLLRTKKLTEMSNLDDFVCVLALDYIPWCRSVKPEERIPGVDFFNKRRFEDPRFRLNLVTVNNLRDHLASLDQRQVNEFRSKFAEPKPAKGPAQKPSVSSRKPFFETVSQLPRAQDAPESNAKRTPSNRKLPWAKPTPTEAPSSPSRPRFRVSSPQPHVPERSSPMTAILSKPRKAPTQQQQGSPILGSSTFVARRESERLADIPSSPLQPKSKPATPAMASSLKQRTRTPMDPEPKTLSASTSNISLEALNRIQSNSKGVNSVEKVTGWVAGAKDFDPPEGTRSVPRPVNTRPAVKELSKSFNGTETAKVKDDKFVASLKRLIEKRERIGTLSRRGTPDRKGKGKERATESFGSSSRHQSERKHEEPETQGWEGI